jgi:hypothetical protein
VADGELEGLGTGTGVAPGDGVGVGGSAVGDGRGCSSRGGTSSVGSFPQAPITKSADAKTFGRRRILEG